MARRESCWQTLIPAAVERAATAIGCDGRACNVTDEADIIALVDWVIDRYGRIGFVLLECRGRGAGVLTDAENVVWQNQWELHVMSHVYRSQSGPAEHVGAGLRLFT